MVQQLVLPIKDTNVLKAVQDTPWSCVVNPLTFSTKNILGLTCSNILV